MDKSVVIKTVDNVATCLADMKSGEKTELDIAGKKISVTLQQNIPFGHKFALTDIATGENILKYAEIIGIASRPILVGEHVHIHNVESVRARGDIS